MKKPGIIMSIIVASMMFIYTMSLVSSQNICTGVRSYECIAFHQQAAAKTTPLAQTLPISTPRARNIATTQVVIAKTNTPTSPQTIPTTPATSSSTSNSSALAAQKAAAAALAQQQAAAAAAQQQAAQLAAQQKATQQQAAAAVRTTTRAS